MFEDYRMLLMNNCNVVLLHGNCRKYRLNRTKYVNLVTDTRNCVITKKSIEFMFAQNVDYYFTSNTIDRWVGWITGAIGYQLR
jgi:hypothetical protein